MIRVPAQKPSLPTKLCGPIAFVGEAPSDEEEEKGVPLVGPSGRIFNAVLRSAGIDRRECWVGNVFDEKLPENNVANWCYSTAEARAQGWTGTPPPIGKLGVLRPEHAWHLQRLAEELEAVRPSIIVPLGGTALWAFTGNDSIGEVRGAAALARYVAPGVKIFPTFHPAYIQKDWRYFSVVIGDFVRAMEEARRGPELQLPDIRAVLEPTIEDLRVWRPRLLGADLLSNDIETAWGFITCIGFSPSAGEALVVPFVDIRQPDKSYWRTPEEELDALRFVKEVLESPVPKLGQNYLYDTFWLLWKWGIRPMNFREDTRVLHHSLYPELPKSLAFMGASYTDQGPWKMMRGRKREKRED